MSLVAEYQELEKIHGLCQRCYRSVSEQWQQKLAKFRQSLEILDGVVVVDDDADRCRALFEQLCIRHQEDIERFFNGESTGNLPEIVTLTGLPYGNGKYIMEGDYYQLQTAPSWWSTPTIYRLQRIFGRWQLCTDTIPVGIGKLGGDHRSPLGQWSSGGLAQ